MKIDAFRIAKISFGLGENFKIYVPSYVNDDRLQKALLFTEKSSIKHGGAFTEITYQALLDCIDWFRFKKPEAVNHTVTDYITRMERSIKRSSKFQRRASNADFIETYFGRIVARQLKNINNIRSAVYDVIKRYIDSSPALDASFVGTVYVIACYQCSVMDTVLKTSQQLYKVNFSKAFQLYYIDDVAKFSDRLLRENWGFDIVLHQAEIKKSAEYVLNDIASSAFNLEADKNALEEAYLEIPKEKREKYGKLKDVILAETGIE